MFVLSKILTYALLPPGVFILGFAAAGVLAIRGRRRAAFVTAFACGLMLYAGSVEPGRDLFMGPLENTHPALTVKNASRLDGADYDAVVVLGGGTVRSSPAEGNEDAPGLAAYKRTVFGYRLARATAIPLIFTGGSPMRVGGEPEAEVAARAVLQLDPGMEGSVRTEGASRTTWENALYVRREFDPQRIILVTSAWHMRRSVRTFTAFGMDVTPAPTDYRFSGPPYNLWSFMPDSTELADTARAIHEYVGLVYYRMKRVPTH